VVSLVSSDVEGQVNRLRKVLGIPGRSEAPESATAIRLGEVNDEAATERLDGRAPSKPARPARTSASPSRGPRPERREYTPRSESPRDERPRRDDSRAERSHVERPRGERTERREPRADRGASTGPSRGFERDRRSERPVSATKFDRDSSPSRGTDTGTVSFFNESKGYGFAVDGQGRDHFIHFSNIQGDGFRTLEAGQQVTFESATGAKGLEARNVRAVSTKPRRR
jgi:CspA family cold shock protein